MDDTQQSRVSDANATRKRRSSILKSQRPPRTPLSELEFHVATPTDTAKSRRVSFSRRTGVAEFVTNEATTTWKNFYEEHNKSLESSGNDSGANATRQPIGHLGKRIFDQQFEEVEAVDFITSLDNLAARNSDATINVNLTEPITSTECADDKKPFSNFELSAFTDHHSKIYSDDLAGPRGEMSGRLDVDYSEVELLGMNDDLDEIQRDLQRRCNVIGPAPFRDARDFSEYIEVDFNTTQAANKIEESDMSITETIRSPKVNVSKTFSPPDQKYSLNWLDDKENNCIDEIKVRTIIYDDNADMTITTTLSSKTDASVVGKSNLNTVSNATLRFEDNNTEKHKTILFEDDLGDLSITKPIPAKILSILSVSQEKNNLNDNSNMPNIHTTEDKTEKRKTLLFEDDLGDLSMTKPISAKLLSVHSEIIGKSILNDNLNNASLQNMKYRIEKRRTISFEDNLQDVCVTKPIPYELPLVQSDIVDKSNANSDKMSHNQTVEWNTEKRKTILFDDGDLSMTKPIAARLLSVHSEFIDKSKMNDNFDISNKFQEAHEKLTDIPNSKDIEPTEENMTEKRRTILFEDYLGDLSMTKPIPAKLLANGSVSEEKIDFNDVSNKSSVQTVNDRTEKRKTILFDDDLGDLSMTKPIPAKLLSIHSESREKTDLNDAANKSNVQIIEDRTEKRRTIVFEHDLGDLSMTKPIAAQLLSSPSESREKSDLNNASYKSNVQIIEDRTEKRRTIVFEHDLGDLSMTKPIPAQLLSSQSESREKTDLNDASYKSNVQIIEDRTEKRRTILFEHDLGDLSMTKPIPSKLLSIHSESREKTDFNDATNKSNVPFIEDRTEKRRTILFEDDLGNLSMTKPIPANFLPVHSDIFDKSYFNENINKINDPTVEIKTEKPKSVIFDEEDLCITKPITNEKYSVHSEVIGKSVTSNEFGEHILRKSQTIVHDNDENIVDMTILGAQKPIDSFKTKIESVDDGLGNMLITKPIPAELITVQSDMIKQTQEFLDNNDSINAADNRHDVIISKPIPMDIDRQHADSKNITKTSDLVSVDFTNFKSQDVVVYQVTTNEISKEKIDTSDLLDNDIKNDDVMTVQSNENKDLIIAVNSHEDHVKEENHSIPELQKVTNQYITREDISRNTSMNYVADSASVMRTISKKSLLYDLLDMSNASMSSGIDDKNVTANITSRKSSSQDSEKADGQSVTSELFYITRDTDSESRSTVVKDNYPIVKFLEKEPDEVHESVSVPQSSIQKESSDVEDSKAISTDMSRAVSLNFDNNEMETYRRPKSFGDVNNTKQLLDMLSDLTDGQKLCALEESQSPTPLTVESQNAIYNKEINEPNRVSLAPNRQSIVLSRENLLSNISMAQAALQMSLDMEDIDIEEPTPTVAITPPRKSVRMSNEVVKTLHFEDESASEVSVKSDIRSPLRKTAFGETSYMTSFKSKVIPTYLKDVSDGIKSLMHDLVKPVSDEMPFEAVGPGKILKKDASTCSTQIQANLYTSSQIDVNNELYSNSDILSPLEVSHSPNAKCPIKSVSFIGSDLSAHSDLVSRNLKEASFRPTRQPPDQTIPGKLLVFDQENPLNNVLLMPTEFTEVHKYCPGDTAENLEGSEKSVSQCSVKGNKFDVGNVAVRYDLQNLNVGCQSGDADAISNQQSITSNISKPMSVDQSICVKVTEVKDIEVNTAIAMKKNKELLETSSSLTLVDDALARSAFDVDLDSAPTDSYSNVSDSKIKAPLRVIYKLKHDYTKKEKVDSDLTSNDEAETVKAKKRIYSPGSAEKCKNSTPSKQTVTPKPTAKMQRLSNSPNNRHYSLKRISGNKSLMAERDCSSAESKMDIPSRESPRKRSPRKKSSPKKEPVSLTVQQLLTEFNVKPEIDQTVLNKQILEALSGTDSSVAPDSMSECERSVGRVSSFASSKNQCKARPSSTATELVPRPGSPEEWAVDRAPQWDSSVNVVAKIDMLPFMGSHECEWASSGTDSWCFQLLHGRLRLAVRLAHRHHNATRTRVRADTPVIAVAVYQSHHGNDQKSSVAMSCITFACLALRSYAGACASAGDVPALLRRGAAVARSAMRWGRAMHEARTHLAYTLSDDHRLVLKVANIPLRCVWEVSMRITMSPADKPWPRASEVRATRVLDSSSVLDARLAELLAAVPDNWGHVPATVWRLFRYLKNKTPDAEENNL